MTALLGYARGVGVGADVTTSVSASARRCENCGRALARDSHPTRKTCGKRCRQKLSRKRVKVSRKVSRGAVVARHVLSDSAKRRALDHVEAVPEPVPMDSPSKRVFVVGKVVANGVKEVRIA